ncbi:MAG: hypothetical protein NC247_11280 [Ruminococcus flavefaciens]|nr:hypothetical protein [Ruminococcus flavefaciens]MCM1362849.1 hypothetical protein [Clostridiales bacterium]
MVSKKSTKGVSSIEELVEDWAKRYFDACHIEYMTKTESKDRINGFGYRRGTQG